MHIRTVRDWSELIDDNLIAVEDIIISMNGHHLSDEQVVSAEIEDLFHLTLEIQGTLIDHRDLHRIGIGGSKTDSQEFVNILARSRAAIVRLLEQTL